MTTSPEFSARRTTSNGRSGALSIVVLTASAAMAVVVASLVPLQVQALDLSNRVVPDRMPGAWKDIVDGYERMEEDLMQQFPEAVNHHPQLRELYEQRIAIVRKLIAAAKHLDALEPADRDLPESVADVGAVGRATTELQRLMRELEDNGRKFEVAKRGLGGSIGPGDIDAAELRQLKEDWSLTAAAHSDAIDDSKKEAESPIEARDQTLQELKKQFHEAHKGARSVALDADDALDDDRISPAVRMAADAHARQAHAAWNAQADDLERRIQHRKWILSLV